MFLASHPGTRARARILRGPSPTDATAGLPGDLFRHSVLDSDLRSATACGHGPHSCSIWSAREDASRRLGSSAADDQARSEAPLPGGWLADVVRALALSWGCVACSASNAGGSSGICGALGQRLLCLFAHLATQPQTPSCGSIYCLHCFSPALLALQTPNMPRESALRLLSV